MARQPKHSVDSQLRIVLGVVRGEQGASLDIALRAAGLVKRGRDAIALLEEAVSVLTPSPARLEHARALTDLGAALRRANRRSDARGPLGEGMELAWRCGARALADRARLELMASGARPRRFARSGTDALTPSERRVAHMAAEGMTNREIAETLFVTLKTIEVHLNHAYRKLGIGSRRELRAALGAPASAESTL